MSSDTPSESTSIGSVETTDSKSTAGSPVTWTWSRRPVRRLSGPPVRASDAGSSERRTSPISSARQLAAQAILAPCSASMQTSPGVPS